MVSFRHNEMAEAGGILGRNGDGDRGRKLAGVMGGRTDGERDLGGVTGPYPTKQDYRIVILHSPKS